MLFIIVIYYREGAISDVLIAKLNAYGFNLTSWKLIHDNLWNRIESKKPKSIPPNVTGFQFFLDFYKV